MNTTLKVSQNLRVLFALVLALALPDVLAYGPALQPGTVFDGITGKFQTSSAGWMTAAQSYAQKLFLSLAAIEFTWAAIQLTLKKGELNDMIASTMLKVVGIGFFYSMLMVAPTWIPAIMDSFGMAGSAIGASGGSATMLSPSGIFDQGINVASAMVSAMNSSNTNNLGLGEVVSSGGASIGSFMFGAIVTGLAGLLTILAFTLVAVQLMVTLIESYIVIGGGMLMMGFLGSRWTLPFGEKYFGYAVSTGIKLFTLYLIVGQGQNVADAIVHGLSTGAAPGPVDFLGAGASSLAYGAMGYMVPSLAGSMMNGSPALSLGNMAAAGGGLAGSMVAGAAMAGATALSGANAAMGAFGKTTGAAGKIGGEAAAGLAPGGSIGGGLPGGSGGGGMSSGFGGGNESAVAAPPGMSSGADAGGSAPVAKPEPAPAAMAAANDASSAAPASAVSAPAASVDAAPASVASASAGNETASAPASADSAKSDEAAKSPAAAPASSAASSSNNEPAGGGAAPTMSLKDQPIIDTGTADTTAKTEVSNKAGGAKASVNVSPSANTASKGGADAVASTKKKGMNLEKKAESLNDMARRMNKLPVNDGHSGGISIRFNHVD